MRPLHGMTNCQDYGSTNGPCPASCTAEKCNAIYDGSKTSDTGVETNPLGVLLNKTPSDAVTIPGHVEWLTLRTASLHRWVAAGEKDLLLETLRRMEDNIRAIRSLLNKDAESAAESELKFQETLRTATKVANKTERKDRNRVFWLRGAKW